MTNINYRLVDRGSKGRLRETVTFKTQIRGYSGALKNCELQTNGNLVVYKGFEWDFGSGAIDTPAMVIASLAHDAMCNLTNARVIPWKLRKEGDKLFRNLLKKHSNNSNVFSKTLGFASRWWRWAAVRTYSIGFAKWKDQQ